MEFDKRVDIDYTNWRGERRVRRIEPQAIGIPLSSEFHPQRQWCLQAIDCEDGKQKDFALKDIHSWKPAED
jgi:predicted DNA-binding transcriptional regulator YafY